MNPLRHNAVNCLFRSCGPVPHAASLRTLSRLSGEPFPLPKISTRALSFSRSLRQKVDVAGGQEKRQNISAESRNHDGAQAAARKPSPRATQPSSLRRVAVEAQRSRGPIKGKGNKRFVDPDAETKVCLTLASEQCKADPLNLDSDGILRC